MKNCIAIGLLIGRLSWAEAHRLSLVDVIDEVINRNGDKFNLQESQENV